MIVNPPVHNLGTGSLEHRRLEGVWSILASTIGWPKGIGAGVLNWEGFLFGCFPLHCATDWRWQAGARQRDTQGHGTEENHVDGAVAA